jgi:hypothetical protein
MNPAWSEATLDIRPSSNLVRQGPIDSRIILRHPHHAANRGRNEQVALDMPKAPDEELESRLSAQAGVILVGRVAIVPIEHHKAPEPTRGPTALAKIGDGPCRTATSENDRLTLDTAGQRGLCLACPTAENFPIARAFDVENEVVLGLPTPFLGCCGRRGFGRTSGDARTR